MMNSRSVPTTSAPFGNDPLFLLPDGKLVNLASGYIPLLVNFTFEDKAAKGLRKRGTETTPEIPVHFSALELVRDYRALLLVGPTGSGKTTFAKHLCFRLAKASHGDPSPLIRNEIGQKHEEVWKPSNIAAHYFNIDSFHSLQKLSDSTLSQLLQSASKRNPTTEAEDLIIIDGIEKAGEGAVELLSSIVSHVERSSRLRLLVLGETEAIKCWTFPAGIVRHEMLPLLQTQRREVKKLLLKHGLGAGKIGLGAAAANPAIFALSVESSNPGEHAEEVLDAWLASITTSDEIAAQISVQALEAIAGEHTAAATIHAFQLHGNASSPLFSSRRTQELLAARQLAEVDIGEPVRLFHNDYLRWKPVLQSLLARAKATGKIEALAEAFVRGSEDNARRGALLLADHVDDFPRSKERIKQHILAIVEYGRLSGSEREHAGRVLSRLGDPRNLTALAQVPAGTFTLGSDSHPNSQPPASITLRAFSIGLYPVVNRDYAEFVKETGRAWVSPDGYNAERQNAPATDLTWHDARAYCSWLTVRWLASGKISSHEKVRLPTEPEWERAARGQQDKPDADGVVYPWGTKWQDEAANSEEAGFNNTCTVGLFPKGRSPYGCFDMTGQVWEWCTTLWGEDMATPSFQYPWQEDGRESLDAPRSIRRVLRGGCFSSGKLKACCTYRGSLEPYGFWRGNGFRIVVASDEA